ncbi:MAG TPA: Ig-like domain-containing protein [Vicinamibacterales bacterium]
MRKFVGPLFLVVAFLALPAPLFAQCGVERWSVKTGTDADVGLINLSSSTPQTIATMRSWPAPNPIPPNNRVSPYETTQWVLNATLTQYKLESDSDYHLILQDAGGLTMIAEIPSPNCVGSGSPFGPGITNARSEFDARYTATTSFQTANIPVQVTGVGMFDFLHGQTGVAPNGIEIHAVLDIIFNPSSNPDFSISDSPTALSVVQGNSGTSTVTTAVSGGFNSAVALSISGLPTGTTASFNPTSIAAPGSGSSTVTLTVGSSTATGTYPLTITGTGGGKTHTTSLSLTVTPAATPDFSISDSPSSLSVVQGASGSSTVTTAVSGGFNSAVALSASGLPTGATASFTPASIAAPGSGSSTATITVGSSTATGTYSVTITGTGGGKTHTTSLSLTVTPAGGVGALTNGGFETGTLSGWTASGVAAVNSAAKHTGSWGAQLGNSSPSTDSSISQTFTLPTASPTLSFWYANTCPDTVTYDWATATLKDNVTGTTTTLLPQTCTASPTWTQVSFNAASSAGHSVTLTLTNHDDNYSGDPTFTYFDDVAVSGGSDTTPPTTSITAPANGATVSGTVNVTATASDNVGVTKMEIYVDGGLASSNTNATSLAYSWNTTSVANGSHTLMSKAYDAAGNVGTSATVTVTVSNSTDTTPPTTSITAPANGATVSATINVTATASDNVGVTKMEIYIDGALKTSNTNATSLTYSWNTTTAANGSHTLVSKAYDAAGNVGTSATVTVTVSNGGTQQLMGNPGFENGSSAPAPWVATSGVISNSTSEAAHSGSWKGWMDGYGTTHTDTLYQQVAIPSTITTATLTFWLHIDTAETSTTTVYDTLNVQVRNSSGTVLATLATYSNLNAATGYVQKTFDLSGYKGQTIQIYLVGAEDSTLQTSFVVDDFALNVQ